MSRGSRAALLAMAITGGGCAIFSGLSPGEEGLAFSHAVHAEEGLECGDCHAGVDSGESPGMPSAPQCMLCHADLDQEKPPEKQVASLFTEGVYRAKSVSDLGDEVIFSHGSHVGRGEDCAACHGTVASSARVDASMGVTMDECTACHASKEFADDCSTCHREIREDVKPPSHDLAWEKVHGKVVRGHSQELTDRCSLCHTESTCSSCHADTPPENHDNLWRLRGHGIAAAMDRQNCAACHRSDSCQQCHEETLPLSHTGMWGAPRDTHCLSCHFPLTSNSCVACHKDTPSHQTATPMPTWHNPGMDCRQCHGVDQPLPHVDNGSTCTACHQ
ncbi:MAG: cytochrome c3 family protein [Planctomycetota bacterium]